MPAREADIGSIGVATAPAVAAARHVEDGERPDELPGTLGSYDPDSRTIALADVDSARVDAVLDHYGIEDRPDGEVIHPEPLFAHELTHAIQYDRIDSTRPADRTRDERQAANAVAEGTTEYVERRNVAASTDEAYDPCAFENVDLEPDERPLWTVADGGLAYRNGAAFARAVLEEGGWDALWDRHRSPPRTTAEITLPERQLEATLEPAAVESPEPPAEGWLRPGTDRLGVFALYTKLHVLGLASPADPGAEVAAETTAETGLEGAYRSSLFEGAGDRFATYGHADDRERVGYRWRTEWSTESAARELATAVARGYDEPGTARGDDWLLDGDVHTLARVPLARTCERKILPPVSGVQPREEDHSPRGATGEPRSVISS